MEKQSNFLGMSGFAWGVIGTIMIVALLILAAFMMDMSGGIS
jgi:hypothetical protein